MIQQTLRLDHAGVLWLRAWSDHDDCYDMRHTRLGPIEDVADRVPAALAGAYEALLDEYRDSVRFGQGCRDAGEDGYRARIGSPR